jgi:hypothetical protein
MLTTLSSRFADSKPRGSRPSAAARVLTIALRLAGLLLVGFHAVLLLADLDGGRLVDPAVAAQWIVAGILFAALVTFWRLGVPLLWGRKAAVLWVLVLLLHGVAQPPADAALSAGSDATAGTLGLVFLPVLAGGIATLALAAARRLPTHARQHAHTFLRRRDVAARRPSGGFTLLLAARPPPSR